MTYADRSLPEFDDEMAKTRLVLERVPADQFEWRLHPKSNTIGWLANHLAELPGWAQVTFEATEWDFAPIGGKRYESPKLTIIAEILALFDANVAGARRMMVSATEEQMNQTWTLLAGGNVIFTLPRSAVIRSFVMNHMIHHRAILCVNLRLKNIPVPGMYGPSGDD
jgi:uncharacterized damage-inducible protein DinB